MRFVGFLAMLGIGVLATHGSVAHAAAPEGYKWKVTTSMQMGSMRMPGQTTTICRTGEESPAIASKEGCETKDFQRSGKTETFRVVCTGEHAMEGTVKLMAAVPPTGKGDGSNVASPVIPRRTSRPGWASVNFTR